MNDKLVIKGRVKNSQYMHDTGKHELTFENSDMFDNVIDEIIDFCNEHEGKQIKITIEEIKDE